MPQDMGMLSNLYLQVNTLKDNIGCRKSSFYTMLHTSHRSNSSHHCGLGTANLLASNAPYIHAEMDQAFRAGGQRESKRSGGTAKASATVYNIDSTGHRRHWACTTDFDHLLPEAPDH